MQWRAENCCALILKMHSTFRQHRLHSCCSRGFERIIDLVLQNDWKHGEGHGSWRGPAVLRPACSVQCTSVELCFWDAEWSCAWFPFFINGQNGIIDCFLLSLLCLWVSRAQSPVPFFPTLVATNRVSEPLQAQRHTRLGACSSWTGSHNFMGPERRNADFNISAEPRERASQVPVLSGIAISQAHHHPTRA